MCACRLLCVHHFSLNDIYVGGCFVDGAGHREGWGSAEATEMVLNNLFYVTVKFGDDHPREMEEVWAQLCTCWPTNLRVILRYLFIVTGMAANELLVYVRCLFIYFVHFELF